MERGETVKKLSSQQVQQLWAEQLKGEFETKDVEATLATMVDDAVTLHTGERRERRERLPLKVASQSLARIQ